MMRGDRVPLRRLRRLPRAGDGHRPATSGCHRPAQKIGGSRHRTLDFTAAVTITGYVPCRVCDATVTVTALLLAVSSLMVTAARLS